MSFLQQYNALLAKVEDAVDDALEHEAAEEVKDIMEEQTGYQIYSYDASAMEIGRAHV